MFSWIRPKSIPEDSRCPSGLLSSSDEGLERDTSIMDDSQRAPETMMPAMSER